VNCNEGVTNRDIKKGSSDDLTVKEGYGKRSMDGLTQKRDARKGAMENPNKAKDWYPREKKSMPRK